uniref:Uncharacterized protein n=1 Tax=Arundo donax TaxID=35708 RepID=A0A0A9HA19_ARUDO
MRAKSLRGLFQTVLCIQIKPYLHCLLAFCLGKNLQHGYYMPLQTVPT